MTNYAGNEERKQLMDLLKDKYTRLTCGKIYKIKNKEWQIIPFIPNEHQLHYYRNKHSLNTIPKARQLWFSTAIDIDFFDDFLFRRNFNVGIIADTDKIASDIFRDKIRIAWDNLPPRLRSYYKVNTDKSNELSLNNTGSRIHVSTSFRWWTLQRLHISEFGKICSKYPAKAEEIVTGALQTVATWQVVTIESTAMGAEWYFYDFCKRAKEVQDMGRLPNAMEYRLFFFPWWVEKSYSFDGNMIIPQILQDYYSELSTKEWIFLTEWQKKRYALKYQDLKDKMFNEYPSTFDEAFNLSIKGSYYEKELLYLRTWKRVCSVPYDDRLMVHTAWDIWWAWGWDDTVIWFFQTYGNEIRVIDYRQGNWMSLIEIIEQIIKAKPYKYWTFYWPHDLWVIEYSIGISRFETAKKLWIRFQVLPKTWISEWINMVRNIFPQCWFDESKCKVWLDHLARYRREWDERNWIFLDHPSKNGADHAADAFRYLAMWVHKEQTPEIADVIDLDWWL